MDFELVCQECIKNDELVNEFCRLKGIKRPDKRSPIEIQIDRACGFDANRQFVEEFAKFCFEFIYIPVLQINKE